MGLDSLIASNVYSQRVSRSRHEFVHFLSHLGWIAHNMDAGSFESSNLVSCTTLASDFTNHNDALSLGIVNKLSEHINEVSAVERTTTDTNDCGLSEALSRCLVDSFIGQGTGT